MRASRLLFPSREVSLAFLKFRNFHFVGCAVVIVGDCQLSASEVFDNDVDCDFAVDVDETDANEIAVNNVFNQAVAGSPVLSRAGEVAIGDFVVVAVIFGGVGEGTVRQETVQNFQSLFYVRRFLCFDCHFSFLLSLVCCYPVLHLKYNSFYSVRQ